MNAVLFGLVTLLSSFSFAQSLPDTLCLFDSRCTAVQKGITDDYRSGSSLTSPTTEVLYSGGCYMLSQTYSPQTKHHGYIYLRQENQGLGFFGNFSFFYSENPYAKMTAKDASARHASSSKYFVDARDNAWLIEMDSKSDWRYFMRQSLGGKTILIGQWGNRDSIICEMTENH